MNKTPSFNVSSLMLLLSILVVVQPLISQVKKGETTMSAEEQLSPFDKAVKDLSSSDPYVRRQAAEQLGMLRDIRAVPYLKKLLQDENPFVRQTAVDQLGLLRATDAVDDIIKVIKTDKEIQVRQSAVVSLGYIGVTNEKVIRPLIELLRSDVAPQLKYATCNTLSILRSTEPIPVLAELLSSDDVNLRRSAIYALGKISHPDSISALRSALEKNVDDEVIAVDIIRFLVDFGDKESVDRFKIIYSTKQVSDKVRFFLAYGIAKLSQDITVLPVVKKGLKSSDETIKNAAIEAIGFIGDKECLTTLLEMKKIEKSEYTKNLLEISISRLKNKYPQRESTPKSIKK
ncbi:MAG: HEAT repeat domain-containing protein [Endomicrobia bacterium]|nr:HEAT repeat domain-containing protein [Endomicrobiia bacterium]MDW8055845.1 HEAT repeat domain-containing protein [Elusimicrobiota bacterium]